MAKKRVHEIAKEQGVTSKELLASLKAAGIDAKAAASSVDEAAALEALRANGAAGDGKAEAPAKPKAQPAAAQPEPAPAQPAQQRPAPRPQRPTRDSLAGERAP